MIKRIIILCHTINGVKQDYNLIIIDGRRLRRRGEWL